MTEENDVELLDIQPPEESKAEQEARKLLEEIQRGTEVHQLFAEGMKESLLINGHNLDHWREKYKLDVPGDLTPADCKNLSMRLLGMDQEVSFFFAVAQSKSQLIKRGSEAAYLSRFTEITAEHRKNGKKLPGQETLKSMASENIGDIESAKAIADIELKFWKSILEHLHTARKLLEGASMNIAVELKTLSNEKAIEQLAKNTSKY